ncbi:hypothetical protein QBC45DRAFT_407669, partial [Copromyces sp. CBS 386.78]
MLITGRSRKLWRNRVPVPHSGAEKGSNRWTSTAKTGYETQTAVYEVWGLVTCAYSSGRDSLAREKWDLDRSVSPYVLPSRGSISDIPPTHLQENCPRSKSRTIGCRWYRSRAHSRLKLQVPAGVDQQRANIDRLLNGHGQPVVQDTLSQAKLGGRGRETGGKGNNTCGTRVCRRPHHQWGCRSSMSKTDMDNDGIRCNERVFRVHGVSRHTRWTLGVCWTTREQREAFKEDNMLNWEGCYFWII